MKGLSMRRSWGRRADGEPVAHWSWQNLNEKRDGTPRGSGFWYGRAWLWWNGRNSQRRNSVCWGLSWCFGRFARFAAATLSFEEEDDLKLHLGIPYLFSLWFSVENLVPHAWKWSVEKRGPAGKWPWEREIGVSFSHGTLYLRLWQSQMEWSDKDPWWWEIRFNPWEWLAGPMKHSRRTLQRIEGVEIPLPEGTYRVNVEWEEREWRRKRLPFIRQRRVSADVSADGCGGLPIPGKGENSWDCGEDAIFGTGVTCEPGDVPAVVAGVVKSVLESRARYESIGWRPRRELAS